MVRIIQRIFISIVLLLLVDQFLAQDPNSIANLEFWLRSDAEITELDGFIEGWGSLSGTGVATNSVPERRPTIVNNLFTEQAGVAFGGGLSGAFLEIDLNQNTDSFTVFALVRVTDFVGPVQYLIGMSPGVRGITIVNSTQKIGYYNGNVQLQSSGQVAADTYYLLSLRADVTNSMGEFRLNFNEMVEEGPISVGEEMSSIVIGSRGDRNWSFNGDIADVVFFSRVLDDEEMNVVEQYYLEYYAPELDLPDIFTTGFCDTLVSVPERYVTYEWSTGSDSSSSLIQDPGLQVLDVQTIFGDSHTDTFNVVYPGSDVEDLAICSLEDSLWDTGLSEADGFSFAWDTPTPNTGPTVLIDQAGTYSVVITDSEGCTREASVVVTEDDFPSTASLGPDIELCSGNSLSLISGAESAQSYFWNDQPGAQEFIVSESGTYWVEAINDNGCIARDTIEVEIVGEAPQSFFGYTNPCFGEDVQFVNNSIPPDGEEIVVYQWDFDDGMVSDMASPSHMYAVLDTFSVSLYVETSVGCSDEFTETVIIRPVPTALYSYTTLCNGQEALFFDASTINSGSIASFDWTFEGAEELSGPEVSYIFDEIGEFTVQLVSTSDFGCKDTLEQTLSVNGTPTSSFIAETVCLGEPTSFQADPDESNSGSVNQFLWQFGTGSSIFEATSFTFQNSGAHEVTLTVTSTEGCSDDTTAMVFVSEDPSIGFTYGPACVGQAVQFVDTSSVLEGDEIAERSWFFANVDESQLESPSYTFSFPGVYDVTLNVLTEAGCSSQLEEQITVSPLPTAEFTVAPNIGSPPLTPVLTNMSQGAQAYVWELDLGESSMDFEPNHTFTDSGLVLIDLTVISTAGCTDMTSQPLFLTEPVVDLVLLELDHELANDFLSPTLSIRNLGNFDIEEFIIELEIENGTFIQEMWNGLLPRNGAILYPMSTSIYYDETQDLPFFCTRLIPIGSNPDSDLSNNEICKEIGTVGDEVYILGPSPNPAQDLLHISFVNAANLDIEAELYDMFGRRVIQEVFPADGNLIRGYELFLADLSPGRYLLRLTYGINAEVYKIQVLRD